MYSNDPDRGAVVDAEAALFFLPDVVVLLSGAEVRPERVLGATRPLDELFELKEVFSDLTTELRAGRDRRVPLDDDGREELSFVLVEPNFDPRPEGADEGRDDFFDVEGSLTGDD